MELFTPLTPAECVGRLSAAMDDESVLMGVCTDFDVVRSVFGSPRPFAGRVTLARLRVRERGAYHWRSRARFRGRLHAQATGTVIEGSFGPSCVEWMYMGCMVAFLACLAFTTAHGVWVALFMLAATAVIFFALRPNIMKEQRAIRSFLIETLEARVMSGGGERRW